MNREEARREICRNWKQVIQTMTSPAKKRVNREQTYICPLCGNGSGSNGDGITLNPKSKDRKGLKCFKCGFSGDIISLYMEHTGADYNTALSLLAQEIGIEISPYKPDAVADQKHRGQNKAAQAQQSDIKQADDKNTMQTQKAPENGAQERTEGKADYTEYYKVCRDRIDNPEAVSYLSARGISVKTAAAHWIGFDPKADPAKAPGGNGAIQFPCPRIIAPASKSFYMGRSIDPNTPPQYQKSNAGGSNPDIFNKCVIYAQEVREVFITEGAFDALSVIEAGAAAVALNSTSNAEMLIKQLEKKKPAATLILSLDNDEGGCRAAQVMAEELKRLDIPYIAADICGQYKDPNEYLQQDREGFIKSVRAVVAQVQEARTEKQPQAIEPGNDIDDFLQAIQGDKYKPYPTGIKDIDDRLGGGLIKQWLILIGAEPGAGKTAFACQIMENYARQGQECIYFNLEMSKEQLLARSICRTAYQNEKAEMDALKVLRGYKHTERERDIINRAAVIYKKEISPTLIYNPDNTGTSIDAILESMEKRAEAAEKAGKPAPFICLDYLQLVTGGEREDVIATLKRAVFGLKKYALKHNSIVISIMAQGRAANSSGKATISAGRDTSNLEYTCDLQIQMIKNKIPGVIDFFITKSRFAAPSLDKATPLLFKGAQSLFLLFDKTDGYKSASLYGNDYDDEFKPLKGNSPFDENLPRPTKIV